jgi:hypothetical protein
MTLSQIQTLVCSWLDDPQQTYFTPAQTQVWINLAHRQVQMLLLQAGENYYMKPVETNCVIGQSDYILPSDFMVEHRIEIILNNTGTSASVSTVNENRQALTMLTTNEQDFVTITSGPPTNYYLKKDRFTIAPTPDQTYLLRLYYSPMVADLVNSTDIPDVPEQYQEYTAILAAFNGFIKDDRMAENLSLKMQQFETLLKQMAEDRSQDVSRKVVQVQDYDMNNWGWGY